MHSEAQSILITGGAGFIGSCAVRYLIERTNYKVIVLDALTYASNLSNLGSVCGNSRYKFIEGDICSEATVTNIFDQFMPDFIMNFAAETHVDRSIEDSNNFIRTNILGTANLLDCSVRHYKKFHAIKKKEKN